MPHYSFIFFVSNYFNTTYKNINIGGRVKIIFNINTAPAKYSNVQLYVALYNETAINDSNVVVTP